MTILVTGGAGFIGQYLIKELLRSGKEVVSIDTHQLLLEHENLQHYICNLADESQVADLPQHTYSATYHLAAVHTTPGHEPYEYYEANVMGSLNLLNYLGTNNSSPLIFLSSISTYGTFEQHRDERSKPNPTSDYGRSKLQAEKLLEAHCCAKQKKLVIIRPGVVFGKGEGGNFDRLNRLIDKGYFIYPGRKNTKKACIYVKDLVEMMLNYTPPNKSGFDTKIVNGCYQNAPTVDEIVNLLAEIKSKKVFKLVLPEFILKSLATFIDKFGRNNMGIHPDRIKKLTVSNDITSLVQSQDGYIHKYGLQGAVSDWQSELKDE